LAKYDPDVQEMYVNTVRVYDDTFTAETTDGSGYGSFTVQVITGTENNDPAVYMSLYHDHDGDGQWDGNQTEPLKDLTVVITF
jgi:hypothetical protein